MSDILIPSDSDRFSSPESIQDYLSYLEETLDATVDINSQITRERDALKAKCAQLDEDLENAKTFANLIECWGRTDCEIYKHELKATADLAIERINTALDRTPKTCLAEIEAQAVEKMINNLNGYSLGWLRHEDRMYWSESSAKDYVKNLRQQAGGCDE